MIGVRRSCLLSAAIAAALSMLGVSAAIAKPARCFTTDDGHYPCDFHATDRAGSFIVKARGYPTITVDIESAGVAWVFADFGSRNVALPGPYYRAQDDPACWSNTDTGSRICAW